MVPLPEVTLESKKEVIESDVKMEVKDIDLQESCSEVYFINDFYDT